MLPASTLFNSVKKKEMLLCTVISHIKAEVRMSVTNTKSHLKNEVK